MSDQRSLADRAVETIAAIRGLEAPTNMEHPERHAVRAMKRAAEQILSDALMQARSLIECATELQKTMRSHEAKQRDDAAKQDPSNANS